MTIAAKAIVEHPTAPCEAEITDNVRVAIPLGSAIEAESPIVVYNESNTYTSTGPTGPIARTSTAPLGLAPMCRSTPAMPYPLKVSPSAITSLVLGIVSIVFILFGFFIGILAIVFGVVAMQRIRSPSSEYRGFRLAYAGIVTGAIGMISWAMIFFIIFVLPPPETDAPAVAPN